jgi:hypothetical protein
MVAAIAAALGLPSACVPLEVPRSGQAAVVRAGKALVFGRIRMVDAQDEDIGYSPFSFDPWDEPFFGPGPRMVLELRQIYPPGGALRYRTYPSAPIEPDGAFFWILPAGDYVLLGNPRLLGSENFTPGETTALARFTVSTTGKTIYVGALVIGITYDLVDFVRAWRTDEADYEIRSLRVEDERERDLSRLRERFPALPEPVVTERMWTE